VEEPPAPAEPKRGLAQKKSFLTSMILKGRIKGFSRFADKRKGKKNYFQRSKEPEAISAPTAKRRGAVPRDTQRGKEKKRGTRARA